MPHANFQPLTDDLRPGLRQHPAWTTCLSSWLESVRPSEAREWMAGDKETFLRHLDSLAWNVLLAVNPTDQKPDDWAAVLREQIPMWEETATAEEIDAETPLSREEKRRLLVIADQGE